jgi:nitroimidazol reductase NimA-like FMN-containing flavoprotein (pyridoxamine 5'-phosphate oxidase superfamily)
MKESSEDLSSLQALLDRSFEDAGPHMLSIITPSRRPTAEQIASRLTGMRLLAVATVSGDGRPFVGPVDGIFFKGAFHFGSSPDSVRLRHIAERPAVSASHLPGEEFAVTVHGRAFVLDLHAAENRELRATLLDVYTPRYGSEWEDFLDSGPVYARIDAEKMFAFSID